MAAEFRLGIQSYCFRNFKSITALVGALKEVNLPYVEIWPGHLDYRQESERIEHELAQVKAEGITVDSYGAVDLSSDAEDIRRIMEFAQIEAFFAKTSKAFGLCLDTAWFLDAKEDPVAAVDKFADRLYGVHLKDFTFNVEGKHKDVIIGHGGLDLPLFMKKLQDIEFDGYLSLEYEGNPEAPLPDVIKCLDEIRGVIDAL